MPMETYHLGRIDLLKMLGLALLLSGSPMAYPIMGGQSAVKADPHDRKQVERGQRVYKRFCALCHGSNLEGQANWRIRKPDGKLPAPPHDETGHTWHHPDDVLFGIVKYGLVPPYAPENYPSDMPAWGSTLSDGDILAVLAYIKSRWPAETRKIQEDIDAKAQRRSD